MNEDYKIHGLFNSTTKQFVAWLTDLTPFPNSILKNMLIKTINLKDLGIEDNSIDLVRFKWIGDYDTGRLADTIGEKLTIVTEKEINQKYNKFFFEKYKIEDILYQLVLNSQMSTEKGIEMQNFLKKALQRKENEVNFYTNSQFHIYETEEETIKKEQDAFKS